ncbi:MAG: type II toxin-antitoxin system HicB family antitoxin [Gemmatimonadaceae bacterium]
MTTATFTAVFEQVSASDGGGYHAYVEELPGAITQGSTLDEARVNLQDAVRTLLDANRALAEETHAGKDVIRESLAVAVG